MKKKQFLSIFKKTTTELLKAFAFAIGILAVSYSLHIIDDAWETNDEILVEGITCDVTLKEGETYKLTPTEDISYDNVTWSSENEKGLSVTEDGMITAKAAGEYVVTCLYKNQDKVQTTEEFWIRITN